MSGLPQIGTDYKKYLDQVLHNYLPSKKTAMDLFNTQVVDSGLVTLEYTRQTQSYSATKGFYSFVDPAGMADGTRPTADDIGTEYGTSSPTRYGKSFKLTQAVLQSGIPVIRDYITKFGIEKVEIVRNLVNRTLITNMASNAAQSYTASATWASGADPAVDIITAQETFKVASGGQDADFLLLHPLDRAYLKKDLRFQSTLYAGKSLESGEITPKPFGMDVLTDQALTQGTFFLGKKGMFADMYVTENFATYETDEGAAGKTYDICHKWVDQYKLPYYLMYGTGIN